MPRLSIIVSLVLLALIGAASSRPTPPVGAQAATPPPASADADEPSGLAFATLAFGRIAAFPSAPALAVVDRVTLAPGAEVPGDPADPELSLLAVEQGTLTITAAVPLAVTRAAAVAAALATPGALPRSDVGTAGQAVTLDAGDSVVVPPQSGAGLRNDGSRPAVVLVVTIAPAASDAATPAL